MFQQKKSVQQDRHHNEQDMDQMNGVYQADGNKLLEHQYGLLRLSLVLLHSQSIHNMKNSSIDL